MSSLEKVKHQIFTQIRYDSYNYKLKIDRNIFNAANARWRQSPSITTQISRQTWPGRSYGRTKSQLSLRRRDKRNTLGVLTGKGCKLLSKLSKYCSKRNRGTPPVYIQWKRFSTLHTEKGFPRSNLSFLTALKRSHK